MSTGLSTFRIDTNALSQVLAIARTFTKDGDDDGKGSVHKGAARAQVQAVLVQQLQNCTAHVSLEQANLVGEATKLIHALQSTQNQNNINRASFLSSSSGLPISTIGREASFQLLHRFLALQRDLTGWMNQLNRVAVAADECFHTNNAFHSMVQDHHRTNNKHALFIVLLSDMNSLLQQLESGLDKKEWVPPSDFERKTTKYWVEDFHLPEVMGVAALEVPLLVFGTRGLVSQSLFPVGASDADVDEILWGQCASQITSVYLDTPHMKFYTERLRRSEGAQLLRARWYGRKPSADQPIFLELKTHHEVWVNQNSIKQRVTILERDMISFLSFTTWSLAEAEPIIQAATPNLTKDEFEKAVTLLLEMHQLVALNQMRPCVRSSYSRVAFQSSHSNDLRFTVDRNVHLYDEMRYETIGSDGWCISDTDLESASCVVLPYAIFEVKLAGSEMPESIINLIESGRVVEAFKFSKYLSGAAAFNQVKTLPQWAEHPKFREFFSRPSLTLNSSTTCINSIKNTNQEDRRNDDLIFTQMPHKLHPYSCFQYSNVKTDRDAPKQQMRVEPKSYFANERTFIQWVSISLLLATVNTLFPDDGIFIVSCLKLVILACAGAMIVYSVSVYYYRLSLLGRGMPYGYTDRVGPAFVVVAIMFAGCILLVKTNGSLTDERALFLKEDRECHLHSHGISPLEYNPSAIVADGDLLLVPSLSQVTSISKSSIAKAQTLVTIPNTDIGSITVADERIFIVALVTNESSNLIELSWTEDGDSLESVGIWKLDLPFAVEGIAYVPTGDNERLYFGDQQGFVYSTPLPTVESSGLPLELKHLNKKLFRRGLDDPKIASLQYLDGILYVVHSNAGIVRGWDIVLGVLRSEWNLPIPPESSGSTDHFQGFFLEKRPGNIRGGENYQMHIAVDTPAQLWTLSVNVNAADRNIIYPACAREAMIHS